MGVRGRSPGKRQARDEEEPAEAATGYELGVSGGAVRYASFLGRSHFGRREGLG